MPFPSFFPSLPLPIDAACAVQRWSYESFVNRYRRRKSTLNPLLQLQQQQQQPELAALQRIAWDKEGCLGQYRQLLLRRIWWYDRAGQQEERPETKRKLGVQYVGTTVVWSPDAACHTPSWRSIRKTISSFKMSFVYIWSLQIRSCMSTHWITMQYQAKAVPG